MYLSTKHKTLLALIIMSVSFVTSNSQARSRTLMDFLFGDKDKQEQPQQQYDYNYDPNQQQQYDYDPNQQQQYDPYNPNQQYDPYNPNNSRYGQQQQQQQYGGQQIDQTGSHANLAYVGQWPLKKTQWDWSDEEGYSNFVTALGRSGCTTIDGCIRSDANPFKYTDPSKDEFRFWSDCADFPFFLRSYYAWKNGLPFVYSSGMNALPLTTDQRASIASGAETAQKDVRYSWNGNKASAYHLLPDLINGTNYFKMHTEIQNSVHTASYRVDPTSDYSELYAPAIRRGSIRPGTAVYDPQGHVGVVYEITADGQVMVFDAQVDMKSISPRRPYSSDHYQRSKMAHGAWFQNFRPIQILGAQYDSWSGTYSGGTAYLASNAQIPDFSLEMFGNTTNAEGKAAYLVDSNEGQKIVSTFQEFLRRRMYQGQYQLDVLSEFKTRLSVICDGFNSRVGPVQDATKKGIASQPHVLKLPNTIYGGDGDWDTYSTPGGDVRRRTSTNSILTSAKELKAAVDSGSRDYSYRGSNLKADLIAAAQETLNSCAITYTNTAGQPVKIGLESLLKRMPRMSFSPYHCIELRWGASSQEELASCPDLRDPLKIRWYKAEQTLRNQMSRDTDIFTGYSLEELEQKASTLGPATPENFDLIQRMNSEM